MKIKAMNEGGNVLSAVYMKAEESYDENDELLNAVDMSNGGRCWFSDSKPVAPVSGTFVEGYRE